MLNDNMRGRDGIVQNTVPRPTGIIPINRLWLSANSRISLGSKKMENTRFKTWKCGNICRKKINDYIQSSKQCFSSEKATAIMDEMSKKKTCHQEEIYTW
jgi:hypothetical protein